MQLTVKQLGVLQVGLRSLDGYMRIIKDGERETTAPVRFKFGRGLMRTFSKNLRLIAPIMDEYDADKTALILSLADDGSNSTPPDKMGEFVIENNKLMAATKDVELLTFKEEELKLGAGPDENNIPGTVLEMIEPLISS